MADIRYLKITKERPREEMHTQSAIGEADRGLQVENTEEGILLSTMEGTTEAGAAHQTTE